MQQTAADLAPRRQHKAAKSSKANYKVDAPHLRQRELDPKESNIQSTTAMPALGSMETNAHAIALEDPDLSPVNGITREPSAYILRLMNACSHPLRATVCTSTVSVFVPLRKPMSRISLEIMLTPNFATVL